MFNETETKPKKRWQNLLHQKCPNCDTRLEDRKNYFACPNPHPTDPMRNCFFIKKEKAAEYLLDENHPANFCLSPHEKAHLQESLQTLGIVVK